MKKKMFIEGMMCNHCKKRVEDALTGLEGVNLLEVNVEENYALVDTEVDHSVLKETIEDIGYDVTNIE